MPYAPGISYSGDRSILQGKSNLMSALLMLSGKLSEGKEAAKAEAAAGKAADYWYKSLGEDSPKVTGVLPEQWGNLSAADKAQAMKGTVASQAFQEAAQQMQLRQAQVESNKAQVAAQRAGQEQLAPFYKAFGEGMKPSAPNYLQGDLVGKPAQGALQAGLAAATEFPQGAGAAGFPRELPALLRQALSVTGGEGQGMIPFAVGTGDNALSGAIERRTGKTILDAGTQERLAKARAAGSGRAPAGTGGGPGSEPVLTKDGKFYWDSHLQSWKPVTGSAASKGMTLFEKGEGAADTAGAAQFKKGQRVEQDGVTYEFDGKGWMEVE